MRAWRPEPGVTGPTRPTDQDIGALNALFAESFTDRYRRDGLTGVRVPPLNPAIWRYALLDAGEGAMVWRDERDAVVAFNVAHRSGTEGWMGPLAVRPDRQHGGLGKTIVRAAMDRLIDAGVSTLGLETMPRTVENIGFYAGLGFAPGYLTITLSRDLPHRAGATPRRLSERADGGRGTVAAARALLDELLPGVDFTHEILLTAELGLGDTCVVEGETGLDAFVLWHSAPLGDTRTRDEVRVLKVAARDQAAFDAAVGAVEAAAGQEGIGHVSFRCQTAYDWTFRRLVARGYRVRWTDLRMTCLGYPERAAATGVVFSNWEI
jgi:GNAT superfamily N-acetyltransferase